MRIDKKCMYPYIKSLIPVSRILLLTQLIGNRTSCRTIQGNRARNFKSLARLLPELYSTQSYYHHLLLLSLLLCQ